MKVVHFESGLGNQMLAYAEYLAIKKMNPDDECYIETIIYDIPEAEATIRQWNGYELDRIFGLELPNIREIIPDKEWQEVLQSVRESEFWLHDWNYPEAISRALSQYAHMPLNTICRSNHKDSYDDRPLIQRIRSAFLATDIGYNCKRLYLMKYPDRMIRRFSHPEKLFFESATDDYCGFTLLFEYRNNNIEAIEESIRSAFTFPAIDEKNKEILLRIENSESVALHIRRGDMLNVTKKYYTGGYFRRAVKYIRECVEQPFFFVFCDPDSVEWTRQNYKLIGLKNSDRVHFVYWNKGIDSYRDMQLMSSCKHAVVTGSSFGWWGAFLIHNPKKITITPEIEINSTYHC